VQLRFGFADQFCGQVRFAGIDAHFDFIQQLEDDELDRLSRERKLLPAKVLFRAGKRGFDFGHSSLDLRGSRFLATGEIDSTEPSGAFLVFGQVRRVKEAHLRFVVGPNGANWRQTVK
jgi:hypothetical protein